MAKSHRRRRSRIGTEPQDPGTLAVAVVMAAVFVVALGYGAQLPALPILLTKWLWQSNIGNVPSSTGMVVGIYMVTIFVFSPLWIAFADGAGSRWVIVTGLAAYILSTFMFESYGGVRAAYGTRIVSAVCASAVLSGAINFISMMSSTNTRVRSFVLINSAILAGVLFGPAISGLMNNTQELRSLVIFSLENAAGMPMLASALLAAPICVAAFLLLPRPPRRGERPPPPRSESRPPHNKTKYSVLALTSVVTFGLGAFEVCVMIQAQQILTLDPARISVLFIVCSVVIVLVQIPFLLQHPLRTLLLRPAVAGAAFIVLACALALVTLIRNFETLAFAGALIAGTTGMLLTSLSLTHLQDVRPLILGIQMSLALLALGIGSIMGGALFGLLGAHSFWITAAIMTIAAALTIPVLRRQLPSSSPTDDITPA